MPLDWLRTHIDLSNPGLWVVGSLLLAVIATNLSWLVVRGGLGRRFSSAVAGTSSLAAVSWLVVSLFFFLPPVAAWHNGALSTYFAGLTELDWIGGMAAGGLLMTVVIGVILFGWLVYRHTIQPRSRTGAGTQRWLAPLDAALLQWHWAFYRAGVIAWLLVWTSNGAGAGLSRILPSAVLSQPLYWGSWLGMGLVALEWALNPFARRTLTASSQGLTFAGERTVLRMSLAVATTGLFILTRNFWIPLACHVVTETAIVVFLPVPSSQETSERT